MDFFQGLSDHIYINASRLKCLYGMIQGLILFQNPQLRHMAQGIHGPAKMNSKIKRISRFFKSQTLDPLQVGLFILNILGKSDKLIITLDRTHWVFGKNQNNLLVAGILVGSISVPIACINLNKAGNSNTKEREQMLIRLLKIIPAHRIDCLLADREFIGESWFKSLVSKQIPFAIRIKSNTMMIDPQTGETPPVSAYFGRVKRGSYEVQTRIWNHPIRLVFVKKRKGIEGALFLAVSAHEFKRCWVKKYKDRWSIERMFLSMKTNGFNLERSHLNQPDRLDTFILVMAMAFALVVKAGLISSQSKKIPIKNHGRKLYSLFTYGLNYIKETFWSRGIKHSTNPFSHLSFKES